MISDVGGAEGRESYTQGTERRATSAAIAKGLSASANPADVASPSLGQDFASVQSADEVAMVRRAAEVLGINHLGRWLQSEIPSLGNQTPYALSGTPERRSEVERLLLKIKHGVY